jgi:phytoene dehydrogenase-like protein
MSSGRRASPKLIDHETSRASYGPAAERLKSRQRSRVANGSALLPGVDGRSAWVRRCKEIIEAHLSDLGGEDNTSAAERSLIRRAAVLTTELERLEARFASAGEASERDLDLYIRAAGNLRRLLEALGLQRRPRDVAPTLGELLREDAMRQRNG